MRFTMLLANNNRSKAYLQVLTRAGFVPEAALLLRDGAQRLPEQTANDKSPAAGKPGRFIRTHAPTGIWFDEKERLETTLEAHKVPFAVAGTTDVNSEEVIGLVRGLPGDHLVYSGPGGALLKPPILSAGKRFIHVHPGRLPAFRGSTTVYYAFLLEGRVSASAILMEPELDAGPVLLGRDFEVGAGEGDFDYLVDPAVRTAVLLEFMRDADARLAAAGPQRGAGNTFYIIHPVLKHLALMKARGEGE